MFFRTAFGAHLAWYQVSTCKQATNGAAAHRVLLLWCSGLHGETLSVDERHYVVKAWQGKAKGAKQWAAMRLLLELGHHLDPAFFSDTPEGLCYSCNLQSTHVPALSLAFVQSVEGLWCIQYIGCFTLLAFFLTIQKVCHNV